MVRFNRYKYCSVFVYRSGVNLGMTRVYGRGKIGERESQMLLEIKVAKVY